MEKTLNVEPGGSAGYEYVDVTIEGVDGDGHVASVRYSEWGNSLTVSVFNPNDRVPEAGAVDVFSFRV